MQVLVGDFNEKDLKENKDRIAVEKKMKETCLKYTNTKLIKKKGEIVGMRIWVCDIDDFTL